MRLLTRTLVLNTVLAVVGLVAAGFVATTQAGTPQRAVLTFSGDVALPGVVLPAGSYRFEVVNGDSSSDVVRVSNRNGSIAFMGVTTQTPRPAGLPADQRVTFREAPANSPAPIVAWYPSGMSTGHLFVYR